MMSVVASHPDCCSFLIRNFSICEPWRWVFLAKTHLAVVASVYTVPENAIDRKFRLLLAPADNYVGGEA